MKGKKKDTSLKKSEILKSKKIIVSYPKGKKKGILEKRFLR